MKKIILLLVLSLVACNGTSTVSPPSSTPTVVPATQTFIAPTTVPDTATPNSIPPTKTPPSTSTFPDPEAYQWQPILSALQRPVNLQADGSGRLFVIEKVGRI